MRNRFLSYICISALVLFAGAARAAEAQTITFTPFTNACVASGAGGATSTGTGLQYGDGAGGLSEVTGSSSASGGIVLASQASGTAAATMYSQAAGVPASSGSSPSAGTSLVLLTPTINYLGLYFGLDDGNVSSWIQSGSANSLGTNRNLALQPNGGLIGIGGYADNARVNVVTDGTAAGDGIALATGGVPYGGINIDGSNDLMWWTRTSGGSNQATLTMERSGGNLRFAGTAHAVAGSCGTGPAVAGAGPAIKVTTGTGSPVSCAVTFGVAYATAPVCTANASATTTALNVATTTTTVTVSAAALTASETIHIICIGY